MRTLHVVVKNKIATYIGRDGHIVCGNSDYSLNFTFDTEWDDVDEKTARFIWNGRYLDVEFTGNECLVPIINNASEVTVGVYAGELTTTTPAFIPCEKSILCITNTAQPEVVRPYEDQATEAATQAQASATAAAASASAARASATSAASSATQAEASATAAETSAANAETSARAAATAQAAIGTMLNEYIIEIDTLVGG